MHTVVLKIQWWELFPLDQKVPTFDKPCPVYFSSLPPFDMCQLGSNFIYIRLKMNLIYSAILKICFNRIDPCVQWPSEMSQSFRWKVRCFETTMSGSSWKWGPLASFLGSSQFSTSIRSRRCTSYIVNICCQVDMQCFFKCFNIPFYSLPTLNLFILCPEFLLLPLSLIFR